MKPVLVEIKFHPSVWGQIALPQIGPRLPSSAARKISESHSPFQLRRVSGSHFRKYLRRAQCILTGPIQLQRYQTLDCTLRDVCFTAIFSEHGGPVAHHLLHHGRRSGTRGHAVRPLRIRGGAAVVQEGTTRRRRLRIGLRALEEPAKSHRNEPSSVGHLRFLGYLVMSADFTNVTKHMEVFCKTPKYCFYASYR